ncbi:hypothetical protein ACT3CD_13260 [Geofilum sp. OHC36d9]|uniref:hypothetical protein n=1 Tax=Geofilum sp. OHC36d9 TaxID=3458413 RepID=UPI00403375C9
MNRTLLILSLIIILGCSNQPDQFSNGLTKNAKKITEYLINVDIDSLDNMAIDTLTKKELLYNKNGQIIRRVQDFLYNDDYLIIDFEYDISKRLKKEIVEIVNDSTTFTVDYFYNGKQLERTKSEFNDNEFLSKQLGKYYYDSNDKLEKSTTLQQFVDLETKDTTGNTYEINKYNDNKQMIESIFCDSLSLDRNRIYKYDYKDQRLFKTTEYNRHDSLISITLYKYQLDEFGNWIERKSIRNNVMTTLIKREIEYK